MENKKEKYFKIRKPKFLWFVLICLLAVIGALFLILLGVLFIKYLIF